MKKKNIDEKRTNETIEKAINWDSIDTLIGAETKQEILNFDTVPGDEDSVSQVESHKKNNLARNIGLAVVTTAVILCVGAGMLILNNSEPGIQLGEYKEVTIEKSDNFGSEVWAVLVNESAIEDYPEEEVESIKEATAARIAKQAEQYGLSLEQYINSMAMDMEAYDNYLFETAKQEYLCRRVASEVAKIEGFVPAAEEYDGLVQTLCEQMGYVNAEAAIEVGYTMDELKYRALLDIVREWLGENATTVQNVEEVTEGTEETDKEEVDAEE